MCINKLDFVSRQFSSWDFMLFNLNKCVNSFQKLEQSMPCFFCLPLDYHAELVGMRKSKYHVLAVSIWNAADVFTLVT